MKALIIGADAVEPSIVFANQDKFPNLKKMIEQGVSASYSAYTQKGYHASYSSEQNWASIYTGLPPKEHGITTHWVRGEKRRPQMSDFNLLHPFWQVFNTRGYSVGLWAADNCVNPIAIDGYCVSVKYNMIDTPVDERTALRELEMHPKDKEIQKYLIGEMPPRLYPKTLKQQGYEYTALLNNPDLADQVVQAYHFQDSLPNFKMELDFLFNSMRSAQRNKPVDIMFLYTVTTDLISHCCMCCDDNDVLFETYRLLDKYIGDFVSEFNPEITVFLSDHGQKNFKELVKCSDPDIQREAFAARDEVLWLKNGYIAFEAHNGALLFTYHSLKGTFIASGKGIRHTTADSMRTLDVYPTLLEMLEINIPEKRTGFVADIFNRPLVNKQKLFVSEDLKFKSIALIQTYDISITDIILNELYIEQRFAKITMVGEKRYEEIFRNNPRVSEFVDLKDYNASLFDEVYCGFYNATTNKMCHVKIK